MNYALSPDVIHTVYREVENDWDAKLIPQIWEGTIKEEIGKYEAISLISNREKATTQIREILKKRLAEKNILVSNFEINNFDFDDNFENAVKMKVIAVEQAKEAKNKTVRIKEEADQKVIAAKAEAESMRIRANALTQNKSLVEYEAVQKWDGKLPEYMLGNGALPFINIKQ